MRVCYPAEMGRIVLRTELDWNRNVEPLSAKDGIFTFELEARQPFLYFKPCLVQGKEFHWGRGANYLLLMTEEDLRPSYPYFFGSDQGTFSRLVEFPSKILGRTHKLRVYLPPGYYENTLASYPVIFMQDGQNLFFPQEAFMGSEWKVDETNATMKAMNAVDDVVIVGIYSGDRMKEYTKPGYEKYSRSLVQELIPAAEEQLRIHRSRRFRTCWGSSLGGVVSFHTVWQYPETFASAACMSSTFSFQDDLMERVLSEKAPDVGFYLDSGWPGDNYEVTASMAMALIQSGWRYGHNLIHLCFPGAEHNEAAWGMRLHLPLQFLHGAVARASRVKHPVLGELAYRQ
ncbi:alpha/beta hydrolase [bacterium]|nr:alpha/beta hydrolase [bacterium]